MAESLLFVGLGSPHGDDQIGWLVVDEVARLLGDLTCRKAASPAELFDWLYPCGCLEICDAIKSPDPVGTIRSWTWPAQDLGEIAFVGTHDVSLVAMLQLSEQMGRLPSSVRIWGVAVSETRPFDPVSTAVLARVPQMARQIVEEARRA